MQPAKLLSGQITRIFALLILLVPIAGCAQLKEFFGFVTKIDVTFEASSDLNPTPEGRPSPIVVRMYEFNDAKEFKGADFFAIYEKENATIGQAILAKDELEFRPGDEKHIERKTKPETQFIGIIAAYRDLDNAKWRAIIPLANEKTNSVIVHLGSAGLQVSRQ